MRKTFPNITSISEQLPLATASISYRQCSDKHVADSKADEILLHCVSILLQHFQLKLQILSCEV